MSTMGRRKGPVCTIIRGVVVVISGKHLKFTDQHGNVQEVFAKAGESRWFPPFKHKVENLGQYSL